MKTNYEKFYDVASLITPLDKPSEDENVVMVRAVTFRNINNFSSKIDFDVFIERSLVFTSCFINDDATFRIKTFNSMKSNVHFEHCNVTFEHCTFASKLKTGFKCNEFDFKYLKLDDLSVTRDSTEHGIIDFIKCDVRSFDGIGKNVFAMFITRCLNEKFPSFKQFPNQIEYITLKYQFYNEIPKDPLAIFTLDKLIEFKIDSDTSGHPDINIIHDSFLNKETIYECASKLIDAGYEKAAEL